MVGISRRTFLALAGQAVLLSAAAPIVRATSTTPIFHGPRDEALIALTIDDDWSAAQVGAIFDILQRQSVAATFFPYADATRSDPGLWRAITAAGYPYANHTRTHPWITRLGRSAQMAEITEARTILEGMTGAPMLTPLILPTVVSLYRDLGFRFVTVPELLGWSGPAPAAPTRAVRTPAAAPSPARRAAW